MEEKAQLEKEREMVRRYLNEGYDIARNLAIPVRVVNNVVSGLVHLAVLPSKRAQANLKSLEEGVNRCWNDSNAGRTWNEHRRTLQWRLEASLDISKEHTSRFLDDIEQLAAASVSAGAWSAFKNIFRVSRKILKATDKPPLVVGPSGLLQMVNDEVLSKPLFHTDLGKCPIIERVFAKQTPAQGILRFRFLVAENKDVLIFTSYVSKADNLPAHLQRHRWPGCTTEAYFNELRSIGRELGAKRLFKTGVIANKRLKRSWMEADNVLFKGMMNHGESIMPVFELLPTPSNSIFWPAAFTSAGLAPFTSWLPRPDIHARQRSLAGTSMFPQDDFLLKTKNDAPPFASEDSNTYEEVKQAIEPSANDLSLPSIDWNQVVLDGLSNLTGVSPAISHIEKMKTLLVTLQTNPDNGPLQIASTLLQQPIEAFETIKNAPANFKQQLDQILNSESLEQAAYGCLMAVAQVFSFMNSVSWICEFVRDPKSGLKNMITLPYDVVRFGVKTCFNLVRNPIKTSKLLFKSLIKMPEQTVKRFLCAIGLRRKKKKRKAPPQPPPPPHELTPEQKEALLVKYVQDLQALFFLARGKGFIDPFSSIEDYHNNLLQDWEHCWCIAAPNSYFDFPRFVVDHMRSNDLCVVRQVSPRAHPDRPIFSPEMFVSLDLILENTRRLDIATTDLEQAATCLSRREPCATALQSALGLVNKMLLTTISEDEGAQQDLIEDLDNDLVYQDHFIMHPTTSTNTMVTETIQQDAWVLDKEVQKTHFSLRMLIQQTEQCTKVVSEFNATRAEKQQQLTDLRDLLARVDKFTQQK